VASAPIDDTKSPCSEYLPLTGDTVLSYVTEVEGRGEPGLMVMKVSRPRAAVAELDIGGRVRRFDISTEGIRHTEGGWVLKQPLVANAEFKGQYGTVRILRMDASVTVPAGHFDACLETEERSPTQRTRTLYCRGVGIVELEAEALGKQAGRELVRLKSHGPKIELGESGVTVSKGQ